jgi:TolB-like protein
MAQVVSTPAPLPSSAPVVLVAPFAQVGNTGGYAWVGQALQEDLLASIARDGLQAKSTDKAIGGSDTQGALQAGRDVDAAFVVSGSYQVVGDQLRINGQTSDVSAGRAVGEIQATGEVRGLFAIEDSLGSQLRATLPQMPASQLPTVTAGAQGTPYAYMNMTPSSGSSGSGLYSNYGPATQPVPNYVYDEDENPSYSYYPPVGYAPYYDYGYGYPYSPYFYGGVVIVPGFHHGFDHRFGRGFDHGRVDHFFGHVPFAPRGGASGFRGGGGFGFGGHVGFGRR